MADIDDLTSQLANVDHGKVRAIQDKDRVYLVIQDAPAELRRLAAALEKINVTEIKALVAYMNPEAGDLTDEQVVEILAKGQAAAAAAAESAAKPADEGAEPPAAAAD